MEAYHAYYNTNEQNNNKQILSESKNSGHLNLPILEKRPSLKTDFIPDKPIYHVNDYYQNDNDLKIYDADILHELEKQGFKKDVFSSALKDENSHISKLYQKLIDEKL